MRYLSWPVPKQPPPNKALPRLLKRRGMAALLAAWCPSGAARRRARTRPKGAHRPAKAPHYTFGWITQLSQPIVEYIPMPALALVPAR
jgi:hypothetical protein